MRNIDRLVQHHSRSAVNHHIKISLYYRSAALDDLRMERRLGIVLTDLDRTLMQLVTRTTRFI